MSEFPDSERLHVAQDQVYGVMRRDAWPVVLVHGAWHWGGCWDHVRVRLESLGHSVDAPSLPMAAGDDLTAQAEAVLKVVRAAGEPVVLVAHSFGGFAAAAVLEAVPDLVRHAVFLDAWLPEPAKNFFDVAMPRALGGFFRLLARMRPLWKPFHSARFLGVTDPDMARWVDENLVPQPAAALAECFSGDLRRIRVPCTYVQCLPAGGSRMLRTFNGMVRRAGAMGWRVVRIAAGHDAMVEVPEEVAAIIHGAATGTSDSSAPSIGSARRD